MHQALSLLKLANIFVTQTSFITIGIFSVLMEKDRIPVTEETKQTGFRSPLVFPHPVPGQPEIFQLLLNSGDNSFFIWLLSCTI